MKNSRFRLVAAAVSFSLLATFYALLSTPDKVQAAPPRQPLQLSSPDSFSSRYAEAARTLREDDLQAARQLLAKLAAEHPDEVVRARLVDGFYAAEAGEMELAEELLAAVSIPRGELEDWRLFLLAESARKNGDDEAAQSALARLITDHPTSPLRAKAFLEAAELAMKAGDERQVLSLVDGVR
ncbi:MAG TPA: tetratricopeptide repeat protein, partial [Thermoanaerobaculia bacterium]|nr:tetratricopeptide repeat protein [Thermoanaerobaculia bacterium]